MMEGGCHAKLTLLMALLERVRSAGERVVICSSFRRALDLVERTFASKGWGCCRLDGQTPMAKRQPIVDSFNAADSTSFAFLLASRAGGVGFSLVGAGR